MLDQYKIPVESKSDSLQSFLKYDEKNVAFYSSVYQHLNEISDTILREKLKLLIASNPKNYTVSIGKHNDLISSIYTQSISLSDLLIAVKITNTLPVINQFQQQQLPALNPMVDYSKQQEKTIAIMNRLLP